MASTREVPRALPNFLTTKQVAELAYVKPSTVRGQCSLWNRTGGEQGLKRRSSCWRGLYWLDVLDWLDRRGQLPDEYAHFLQGRGQG